MEKGTKREPQIRTSYDEMNAYLVLPLVGADESWTVSEVLAALTQSGIK